MMRFNCPSCGMSVSAPEEYAGRSTRCRRCNNPLVVPQPVAMHMPGNAVSEAVALQHRTDLEAPTEREWDEEQSLRGDREPWFYGYLEKYAKILQILGYVLVGGCAILATI